VVAPAGTNERSLAVNGLRFTSDRDGDDHVLVLQGELDMATIAPLERELQDITSGDARRLVMDLRALSFMDSTGLHLLARTHQRSVAASRTMAVLHEPGCVRRVLEVSGVLDMLMPGRVAEGA
jgi:anti-sigma B factor antagonist